MDKDSVEFAKLIDGEWKRTVFDQLKDIAWEGDEKIDGTNIRVIWNDWYSMLEGGEEWIEFRKDVEFRGKSDRAQLHPQLVKRLAALFPKEKMEEVFTVGRSVCLYYGEGFGDGIQKGGKYFPDKKGYKDFILFDIKEGKRWLSRVEVRDFALALGCSFVPTLKYGNLQDMVDFVKEYPNSYFGDFIIEGLVARPVPELYDEFGERVIVKIKCRDFNKVEKKDKIYTHDYAFLG
jgi:hypothetical protein